MPSGWDEVFDNCVKWESVSGPSRASTRTRKYILLIAFPQQQWHANALQCYITRALPVLLKNNIFNTKLKVQYFCKIMSTHSLTHSLTQFRLKASVLHVLFNKNAIPCTTRRNKRCVKAQEKSVNSCTFPNLFKHRCSIKSVTNTSKYFHLPHFNQAETQLL